MRQLGAFFHPFDVYSSSISIMKNKIFPVYRSDNFKKVSKVLEQLMQVTEKVFMPAFF